MKNVFKILPGLILFVMLASASVYLTSCGKNDGDKIIKVKCVTCLNGGQCINDSCRCPLGYEGVSCQTRSVDKLVGVWNVSEKGSTTLSTHYSVYIKRDTAGSLMLIQNFNDYFSVDIRATIIGDSIFIPEQILEGKRIIGIGKSYYKASYGGYGVIDLAYKVTDLVTVGVNDYGYDSPGAANISVWNR